ncbi:hypothetical protein HERIO_773 [Hepatospora eriocheir]|uniref:Uncharacterized protein n=1 Tax=Hepatospora eriocheir TaxID=1081669 RepID=A0A1X0QC87_9MICR|nr:hypothetical protein HERIO_773 [Hepatospora eriocheir]
MVMQVGKSLFQHKQKFICHRQSERKIWVFDLVDVLFNIAKISLHFVPNKFASTLLLIIETVCMPDSVIHSDK